MVGSDQRSRLLDVLAQNFAQSGLEQMRGGVVAHGGLADFGVDDGIDFVAYADWLLGDNLVRTNALNRRVAALYFGHDSVVIVGVEPSAVANLAAGFGVEGRVIEDDFAFVARLELLRAVAVVDDGEDFAVVGASLAVAFEFGFGELLVRGVSGLLRGPLPGSTSALALFFQCLIETSLIKFNPLVARGVLHEVKGHSKGVVEFKCFLPRIGQHMSQVTQGRKNDSSSDVVTFCLPYVNARRHSVREELLKFFI